MTDEVHFQKPSTVEAWVNRFIGFLVAHGMGPSSMRVLDVRGRKTGRVISTPVNLLEVDGTDYLVAPRGTTHWVRNARASGRVSLRRGRDRHTYRLEELPPDDRPKILQSYLKTYVREVQRYFTVKDGSELDAFRAIADKHPVFRLHETDEAL
jgi:deazaflavin-dependent oxidoreductase (nitroreductase family)